jgi:hypothetical protein
MGVETISATSSRSLIRELIGYFLEPTQRREILRDWTTKGGSAITLCDANAIRRGRSGNYAVVRAEKIRT